MDETINVYQTLNQRERYILDNLEVCEEDFESGDIVGIILLMLRMTDRISQLPLTREQVVSAIYNFQESYDKFFKGNEIIITDDDYPNIKINVYKTLSNESKKTIKILGIKLKNREITSKEYSEILNILLNKLLLKYDTGIKRTECQKLIDKITRYVYC